MDNKKCSSSGSSSGSSSDLNNDTYYVALCPWTSLGSNAESDAKWTIIPVHPFPDDSRRPADRFDNSVQLSRSAVVTRTLIQNFQAVGSKEMSNSYPQKLEIRILDVVPLALESIIVSVDNYLVKRLASDREARTDAKRLISKGKGSDKISIKSSGSIPSLDDEVVFRGQEKRLQEAVRRALKTPAIVHVGDRLDLPLPSDPVTYAPPPPATLILCEPVGQGLVIADTLITIVINQPRRRPIPSTGLKSRAETSKDSSHGKGEDSSDDRFFSAAEERASAGSSLPSESDESLSTSDYSASDPSQSESGELSEDSLDDMITLSGPSVLHQASNVHSALRSASPGSIIASRPSQGVDTPGSKFSVYTGGTVRPTGHQWRTFTVQNLARRIPIEIIHPRPDAEDDDEARVFVDIKSLAKIGCFSGDWVKVEADRDSDAAGSVSWGFAAFENPELPQAHRPVKIFALPDEYASQAKDEEQLGSDGLILPDNGDFPRPSTLCVYVPPVLAENLSAPKQLRISRLLTASHSQMDGTKPSKVKLLKTPHSDIPPFVHQATLIKIPTPLSTNRSAQAPLLAALKRHFEGKWRLVKTGDLIAIEVDANLGRILSEGSNGNREEGLVEEFLASTKSLHLDQRYPDRSDDVGVAWFRVGQVSMNTSDQQGQGEHWGGVVAIDPTSTRMIQAGAEPSKIPSALGSSWEYYYNLRPVPTYIKNGAIKSRLTVKQSAGLVDPLRRRLSELISAAVSPWATHLKLPPTAILLISTQRNTGKTFSVARACAGLGVHFFEMDAYDMLADGGSGGGDVKTEAMLKVRSDRALSCGSQTCVLHLRHVEALTTERMNIALKSVIADSRVLVATTSEIDNISESIRGLFTHEIEISAPDEGERRVLLEDVTSVKGTTLGLDVDLSSVAVKTAALVAGDLEDVVDRALVAREERLEKIAADAHRNLPSEARASTRDVQLAGGPVAHCVNKKDFEIAVEAARKNFADSIGAPKIPNVTWKDVGGLANVKDAVMETIQLPLERPELFAQGLKKRSGILFYGPPGTGKTLLAKAIATEFSLNFFSVKGPELLNMYIGESEANVRRVFQRARDARPCVVFFDELDSVAPKRGNQGDSGGVMDRIVSQLLAELDGMSDGDGGAGGVFVIGATNRPDLLDAALLRPGRFDKLLYLGVSDTHAKQLTILEALTRKFTLHPDTSLQRVADRLPFTYTGADLYALCSDAMLKAITRQASAVDEKIKRLPNGPVTPAYYFDHYATAEDTLVMVKESDFHAAQQELVGSVSAKELEHYNRVRESFEAKDDRSPKNGENGADVVPRTNGLMVPVKSKGKLRGARTGKGKGKNLISDSARHKGPTTNSDSGSVDGEEDDHVICTDHLISDKKGKKASFRDPAEHDEEDLYG
ncbi:MAG: hypothetical protein M1825_006133 [Sarcosagium campestre]|nr:MAG: hypothetical protein M1825_006133 [Sarcosagium campestre]